MSEALTRLEALLQNAAVRTPAFPANSRYHEIGTAVYTRPDGRPVAYLKRRFVPHMERFATLSEHEVTQGERLDHLAARYLGDPELYWRICDANGALRPDELTETVGGRLRMTLPEGIPGGTDA